jgi:hypothetical protein
VHALGARINRMVTRRNLVQRIAGLRHALHIACGATLVESRRGFGWRINLLPTRSDAASVAPRTTCSNGDVFRAL